MHRVRLAASFATLLITVLGTSACGGGSGLEGSASGSTDKICSTSSSQPDADAVVVALFDQSRSTGTDEVQGLYGRGFETILEAFKKGGALSGKKADLVLGAIDENTLINFRPVTCKFDEHSSNPLVRASRVKAATDQATDRLDEIMAGHRQRHGTAILDSLTAASKVFAHYESGHDRYLVVFSDMAEESARLHGVKNPAADCRRLVARERRGPLFPHLDGVKVFIAGAGVNAMGGSSSLRAERVEKFWLCYLAKTGARLNAADYGASLTSFG